MISHSYFLVFKIHFAKKTSLNWAKKSIQRIERIFKELYMIVNFTNNTVYKSLINIQSITADFMAL